MAPDTSPSDQAVDGVENATAALSLSKDPRYYLQTVFFRVENTLFQVPRHHFDSNDLFSTTFMLPQPPGIEVEGSSEINPFVLQGISSDDFRAFLSVMYPMNIPHQYADIPISDWKSTLHLSSMWEFQSLRDLSIQHLSTPNLLDPVSKILLGMKYSISQWLLSGCEQLIVRTEGPRAQEAELLGVQVTIKIYDLREQRLAHRLRAYSYDLASHIEKAFKDYL